MGPKMFNFLFRKEDKMKYFVPDETERIICDVTSAPVEFDFDSVNVVSIERTILSEIPDFPMLPATCIMYYPIGFKFESNLVCPLETYIRCSPEQHEKLVLKFREKLAEK